MSSGVAAEDRPGVLTFEVGGEWTSEDFVAFFAALDRLYVAVSRFRQEGLPIRRDDSGGAASLGRISRAGVAPLVVESVQYASPGSISLLGLGEVLEQLREFVKDLWGRNRQDRAMRELELQARREGLTHSRRMHDLEYLREHAALARELWQAGEAEEVPERELKGYLRRAIGEPAAGLEILVAEGKLTGIRFIVEPPLGDER